ncbi:MAG: DUF4450 domain-containing protein [Chitinophagaceae bacterium]|nr:DUF4450 domain-containing protein [Chitinophagaceae bacterium]
MKIILLIISFVTVWQFSFCQDEKLWYNKERTIRYQPDGTDFVITNGKRRFVRALYGTNTAFRVEAGDLPEFALYVPGMGGNFKFGIVVGNRSKWLIEATYIKATYRPGSMIYEIRDSLFGNGSMYITVLALADAEGMIIQTRFKNITDSAELFWLFGGASGKKFSRDGDIGADPESSFYLHADNCKDNIYTIEENSFYLQYGSGKSLTEEERYEIQHLPEGTKPAASDAKNVKQLAGLFPAGSLLKLADASEQNLSLDLYNSKVTTAPVITGRIKINNGENYFLVQDAASAVTNEYSLLKTYFNKAEEKRKELASRVKVNTPDKYINTIGGALSLAADAIWEDPSYLHGAVAWRMRLNAWRGAYIADPLGWHDRARKHFSSYALSQVTTPPVTGVVMDTALHLARHQEKIGTALFSDGYICRNPNGDIRAHHYDMNLVFVDQLLNHFNWTGDTTYVREMWPLIKRHLAWEKRNFDGDGDGLYDAYAAIWASDALQYSGGGVTHSSAYNYRANKSAAELAKLIGEDGTMYQKEADKIFAAIQINLWLPKQGSFAEYKDLLGKQLVHSSPGLWTIYHAIDAKLADPFQAYQNLRYVDNHIPHIPVKAKGLKETDLYVLSTSNWQPYTWSINNVALAENLHTALAYWQGNRSDEAYRLWRSAIIESMYLGASPGGFQQLSFYDAIRGELYRDFADPVAMAGRTLVEGLFGIQPDALHDTLTIQPGYPSNWNYARLQVPDVHFDFERNGSKEVYVIESFFKMKLTVKLLLRAYKESIEKIIVNGISVKWSVIDASVGKPLLQLVLPAEKKYSITVYWKGNSLREDKTMHKVAYGKRFELALPGVKLLKAYDPQGAVGDIGLSENKIAGIASGNFLKATFFVKVKQGIFEWWQPVNLNVLPNPGSFLRVSGTSSFVTGTKQFSKVDLSNYLNDKVTNIFKHQYLSPRPSGPTLQLPIQGIGNWCYPLTMADINDAGVRKEASDKNEISNPEGIPFATPSDSTLNNIVFTSQWDNFPDSVIVPLTGNASQIHLLMAGSTNPMQSRMINGIVVVQYTDGTGDTLELDNPGNWWPIEQDYYTDGYAFTTTWKEKPERLYLREGRFAKVLESYGTIKGFSNMAIDGGAATVLNMYLNKNKRLQSLTVHAVANDVVIGLMAATLTR